ncbi:MAG: ABC transporter substrate-binding protein, partial [Desulfobacterales bacterium]|nr:ABC transporter substrate-binding protein [Desulfobacterales bacterium]
ARDPRVRDWLIEADGEIDTARRKALYSKALKRISEMAYWAPLFTYVSNNVFAGDLDFTPYPDAIPRFFQATWK